MMTLFTQKNRFVFIKNTAFTLFSLLFIMMSCKLYANEEKNIPPLPRVADAQVFAEFNDRYPIVLNYFTSETQASIIAFYQKHYGEIVSKSLKRERLTIFFEQENKSIRVVISQQNTKRQVDVLIELMPPEENATDS